MARGHIKGKNTLLATILSVISVVLLSCLCGYCYWWKKKKGHKMNERHGDIFNNSEIEDNGKGSELQLFSFDVIVAATKNFSESNMIGKGGFGHVYKVCLHFIYNFIQGESLNFYRPKSGYLMPQNIFHNERSSLSTI
eukprot:TRINITY_DN16987_c0_g1_i12.p1 TRINITY_DN16987_c0_g1~~TRINITY_DN16987_c0_g1_i12.p1  ORF type:complete len:138 (+),score=10.91 TRINITY_DN16987_c0_g1_i12:346-759(+)